MSVRMVRADDGSMFGVEVRWEGDGVVLTSNHGRGFRSAHRRCAALELQQPEDRVKRVRLTKFRNLESVFMAQTTWRRG